MKTFALACLFSAALFPATAAAQPHPAPAAATMTTPVIGKVTASSFTITWTTSQPLNTQVHFGVNSTSAAQHNWILAVRHSATVVGLQPGTTYRVQAESSYYSNPDLFGPVQSVTTLGGATPSPTPAPTPSPSPTPTPTPVTPGSRLFPNAAADWMYAAPTGTGINISGVTAGIRFQVNDHTQGFDYPVAYTDGTHGCTTFTDVGGYFNDTYCVPNPPSGYYPSVGGWGANDGHLVVVDSATGNYYDFWKLLASGGKPTSTHVGAIFKGSLGGNGTPGATAANVTGLAGDILPGELDCATCLNHALAVVVPGSLNSNLVGHQSSATKTDGTVGGAVFREGAKIRFDPSINVASLSASTATKAILRSLQLFGGVIIDQTGGSQISFYSALPSPPDVSGLQVAGQHMWIYY